MAKKYEICEEGLNELREARIRNRDKSVERRLYALILHAEGNTGKMVSELTGYNEKYLYELYRKYLSGGIEAITGNHYGGNRRNMSYEEERLLTIRRSDTKQDMVRYTLYCTDMDGRKSCPEANILRVRALRRLRPQKN